MLPNKIEDGLWDELADIWTSRIREGDPLHEQVLYHECIKLIQPIFGKQILDVGCGEGQFCRHLSQEGGQVMGVDSSQRMVNYARGHNAHGSQSVTYIHCDAARINEAVGKQFDCVTLIMVLMFVKNVKRVLCECNAAIKIGRAHV